MAFTNYSSLNRAQLTFEYLHTNSTGSQSRSAACSGKAPGGLDRFVYLPCLQVRLTAAPTGTGQGMGQGTAGPPFLQPPLAWSSKPQPVGAAIGRPC
ncbi:MORC family CW-type zinc finger protein 2 [Chelonia mydas]|uniref:MORC family CW-type zinc finger protein 2 n=1 Tax=Chelonia mydas TaxID=8469 RepID=M7BQH9_CHEMY|nr:MORC family CW-type zinc finger protein 2 [Chelonia mydas]